jgi:hypothetical protein
MLVIMDARTFDSVWPGGGAPRRRTERRRVSPQFIGCFRGEALAEAPADFQRDVAKHSGWHAQTAHHVPEPYAVPGSWESEPQRDRVWLARTHPSATNVWT